MHESLLGKWVRAERMRDGVADEVCSAPPDRDLSAGERAELTRLRAELAEKDRDIAFLKKYRRTLRHSNIGEQVRAHRRGVRRPRDHGTD
ncbi:hypothetical protein GII33_21415 [Gordonia pseudamarae]|uniref:Transposase n=1 Tax=Gordonia pseudamarae TaxID=2831662 RepID=A0ABX6IP58_9ACTN|nr:hypothetical protein GII33_21415 [Gordonia pseudamarae]QHN37743.1 hypothetical protein GII31_21050 [Gordonia pseudamarae]